MKRDAKNKEKDQKLCKPMNNNDFFRFRGFCAMTPDVPRTHLGDRYDLNPSPEHDKAGGVAPPEADGSQWSEAQQMSCVPDGRSCTTARGLAPASALQPSDCHESNNGQSPQILQN